MLMRVASYLGHVEVVRVLADSGTEDVHAGHDAPLSWVACGGQTAVVETPHAFHVR